MFPIHCYIRIISVVPPKILPLKTILKNLTWRNHLYRIILVHLALNIVFTRKHIARKKGASSWLSALLIQNNMAMPYTNEHFIDAVCFCYGWRPANLPTNCVCGKPLPLNILQAAPTVVSLNQLHGITADLLSQICLNVQVELQLQLRTFWCDFS